MEAQKTNYQYLGKPRRLIDGLEKVTGRARYVADMTLPSMLHVRLVFSPYAHARVINIDKSGAERIPGVVAVLTAQDLPTKNRIMASRNSTILAKGEVRFVGQPVVAVVGKTEAAAQDGLDQIFIDYEPLPIMADMLAAMADDAPLVWPEGLPKEELDLTTVHGSTVKEINEKKEKSGNIYEENHFKRGDVAQGFQESDIIVEYTYSVPRVHQGYLEPHAVIAEPDPFRGSLTIYTSTQGQFIVRDEVARILSLPKNKVRIIPMTFGGGFGAKYGILEPLVGAIALTLKQPVRLILTRSEDFLTTTPSPACIIDLKTGARKDGTLTALQARVVVDNGIYAFALGGMVGRTLGYYKYPNVQIDCYDVITHTPQVGAYRAPGAPQATLALESNMDELARALGLDPLEFRLKNAVETGDPMGDGELWPHHGLKLCLERMREHPAWKFRAKQDNEGIGLAVGGWPAFMSPAASICRVDDDGTIRIHVGSVDISGVNSSFVLIAAEVFGVSPDQVEIIQGDTDSGPFAPNSGGSQVLYSVAGAVKQAAEEAKRKLIELAADQFEAGIDDLELKNGLVQVKGVPDRAISISELANIATTQAGGPGPIIGEGRAAVESRSPGFVVHLIKVVVDPETGQVTPKQYVAVQDVGFAINPLLVEGQIHGGAIQGLGIGLHEALIYDQAGQLLTGSLMDYDLPKADGAPSIEAVLVDNPSPYSPFGIRGVGEPPITAGAAAIANAVRDATGARITQLPIRSQDLWQALQDKRL